jgi:hypothetical protein
MWAGGIPGCLGGGKRKRRKRRMRRRISWSLSPNGQITNDKSIK